MPTFTKTGCSGVNWFLGGGGTFLESIAVQGDGKNVIYPDVPGAAPTQYLQVDLAPLVDLPDDVVVSGKFAGVTNYAAVPIVELYDGARKIFAANPGVVAAVGADFTIHLTKLWSGAVNSSVDWVLLFYVQLDPGVGSVAVDLLEVAYNTGGSGGGTGPGGQLGQNASILIPLMVQP